MNVTQNHKDFIIEQYDILADYDAKRPEGHAYKFHEHSKRVANNVKKLSLVNGYNTNMADALYWATLPHDIGKTILPIKIWDLKNKPTEDQRAQRRAHTINGVTITHNEFGHTCDTDPFLMLMIDIMTNHHECLDGTGFMGKTANDLSDEVRMVCICDAYDGWTIKRPHFGNRDVSPVAVLKRMKDEKSGQFDTDLLNSFEHMILEND